MRKVPALMGCVMALLFTTAASAATPRVFFYFGRANTGPEEFVHDEMGCADTARTTYWDHRFETARFQGPRKCTVSDTSVFLRCMLGKGYGLDPNGYRTAWAWNAKTPTRQCD